MPGRVKLRSTRSLGGAGARRERVVTLKARPRRAPDSPSSRISRSTVQRATRMPSRFSWVQTLSAP